MGSTEAVSEKEVHKLIVSFSLTHVKFAAGDHFGQFMALVTLSPVYIMASYATLLVYRRDSITLYNLTGQMVSLLVNLVLKQCLNQPRPDHILSELEDSGMPSNHAQFIAYFAVINICQLCHKRSRSLSPFFQFLYSFYFLLLAFLVCFSRLYLHYHTLDQVLVGACVGAICALICFKLQLDYSVSITRFLASLPIARWAHFRDYSFFLFPPADEALVMSSSSGKDE